MYISKAQTILHCVWRAISGRTHECATESQPQRKRFFHYYFVSSICEWVSGDQLFIFEKSGRKQQKNTLKTTTKKKMKKKRRLTIVVFTNGDDDVVFLCARESCAFAMEKENKKMKIDEKINNLNEWKIQEEITLSSGSSSHNNGKITSLSQETANNNNNSNDDEQQQQSHGQTSLARRIENF